MPRKKLNLNLILNFLLPSRLKNNSFGVVFAVAEFGEVLNDLNRLEKRKRFQQKDFKIVPDFVLPQ